MAAVVEVVWRSMLDKCLLVIQGVTNQLRIMDSMMLLIKYSFDRGRAYGCEMLVAIRGSSSHSTAKTV